MPCGVACWLFMAGRLNIGSWFNMNNSILIWACYIKLRCFMWERAQNHWLLYKFKALSKDPLMYKQPLQLPITAALSLRITALMICIHSFVVLSFIMIWSRRRLALYEPIPAICERGHKRSRRNGEKQMKSLYTSKILMFGESEEWSLV